ncbi:unnamed protein product [Brugia timori]|uniref:Transmembrane protein n=1 Tax=Brugia timori TaxID=42155 RepID=A0A0R3R446_9BILA|nr:unnamed protein product [Brugia timori]
MSSSRLPSDCTIQGPSWDEFDRSEELDYNSGSDHETDEQGCRSRNFDLVAPPGFCATARQIQMHVDEVRLAQSNYLDQLPNSVNELGTTASSDQQRYEDDPEDPGDPEDPDEGDSQSAMPNMCSFLQFSMPNNIPSSSSQSSSFDPTVPNSSEIFAPSLPEEETKRSRESFLLPPPEPGEAHSSSAGYSLKRMIGPSMPDLLPTVANLGNDDEEDSRDVYGPAIPYDLQNKPSTSGGKDLDVEVPIDDETCGHDNGDTSGVFGPVPPWEQKGNGDDEYAERLVRLEMLQTSKRSACKRPEWMMQPPKCFSSYGLSSKTFSLREDFATAEKAKRDWTETPEQGDPSGAGPSGLSFEAHRNRNVNAIQTQIAAALGLAFFKIFSVDIFIKYFFNLEDPFILYCLNIYLIIDFAVVSIGFFLLQKDRVESLVDVYQRKRKHETDENVQLFNDYNK